MPTGPRFIGSPRPWAGACFHAHAHTRIDRPPDVRRLVSFLRVAYRLFRAPSRQPPPVPFRVGAHCLGFGRLRDITRGRPHPARRPTSLRSVLRLSQPLDGLLRSLASGLVSSPSRVHGSSTRSGGSRSAQCLRPRRAALPPCRSTSADSSSLAARRPSAEASTSRPLSTRSSVRTGSVMSLADGRSPPRVSILQVPCASDGNAASPRSSAHGVHLRQPSLARSPTTIASSVSPPRTGYVCLQTHRPAREFRA